VLLKLVSFLRITKILGPIIKLIKKFKRIFFYKIS